MNEKTTISLHLFRPFAGYIFWAPHGTLPASLRGDLEGVTGDTAWQGLMGWIKLPQRLTASEPGAFAE